MYRFPDDLDLNHLTGCKLIQVSHGLCNLIFSFEPANEINVEGAWRLFDSEGHLVDHGNAQEQKDAYRIHQLLGQKIQTCIILNPTTLHVQFDGGWKLEILDSFDQYESCYISPGIYI